jgi:hypothetical protein
MKIIAEELLNKMTQGKATEEWREDLTFKIHETSTTWKTPSSIRTIDLAQEEVLHLGEEDPWKFRIMTQKTHTSNANIVEEDMAPKRAQKKEHH